MNKTDLNESVVGALLPENIIEEIAQERARQNAKWGEQNHNDLTWLAIFGEEQGEVAQAILHDIFGGKAAGTLREELVQAIAVGVQWLECMDRRTNKSDV